MGITNDVHTNNIIIVGITIGDGDLCLMIWVLLFFKLQKNTPSSISLRNCKWGDFINLWILKYYIVISHEILKVQP